MNRGEVRWINFSSAISGEIRKVRPAVIISNDVANKYLNRVQVIPVTSKTGKLYPSEALITVNGKKNKAMADQLTTVSKKRVQNLVNRISEEDMFRVEKSIRVQLGL